MEWYNLQQESSTRFYSIEHRRDLEAPFYHEFLILKLVDGAVCRIERVGEGSQTDAIRDLGCTSHDVIQWYAQDNYEAAIAGSGLVAIINFDQGFDILDVLAICYGVQHTKASSVYTLQRFNCYFLCLTILAILSRQVANRENNTTFDERGSDVTTTLESLFATSLEAPRKHAILRLSVVLAPNNSHPDEADLRLLIEAVTQGSDLTTLPSSLEVPSLSKILELFWKEQHHHLKIQYPKEDTPNDMAVSKFREDYIHHRVADHAHRVAQYRLAAAPSVTRGMEDAMQEVWELVLHLLRCDAAAKPLTKWHLKIFSCTTPIHIYAPDLKSESRIWFTTPPLTQAHISNIMNIQLITTSKDQGWADEMHRESCSWFDLVIIDNPNAKRSRMQAEVPLEWASHSNEVAHGEYVKYQGKIFTATDDICAYLLPGNCIGVQVVAQDPNWRNYATEGQLVIVFSQSGGTAGYSGIFLLTNLVQSLV
ncbi:hypothetical protein FRC12_002723 [Ceratobasidium sp. 428]|nr:hypothetical protein FRC12_002723 [Ceratobasidium sp. 428]